MILGAKILGMSIGNDNSVILAQSLLITLISVLAFLPAILSSHRSYLVDKGYINGLVSLQQILLIVYAYYIAIPVGQACQRPIEGQSRQNTYFR